jgi:hypothetical protein
MKRVLIALMVTLVGLVAQRVGADCSFGCKEWSSRFIQQSGLLICQSLNDVTCGVPGDTIYATPVGGTCTIKDANNPVYLKVSNCYCYVTCNTDQTFPQEASTPTGCQDAGISVIQRYCKS